MPEEATFRQNVRYERPPILEAILSFKVAPLGKEKMPLLAGVGGLLSGDYPKQETYKNRDTETGFIFTSENGKQTVNATLAGFSFGRSAPYDKWETFISEARRTWNIYSEAIDGIVIQAFSIRYVNELRIPLGIPIHEFFNIYPALPDPSNLLNYFFMRVDTDIEEPPGHVTTYMQSRGLSEDNQNKRANIHIDNTFAFKVEDQIPIWDSVEKIRDIKNKTFESQIKDCLREGFRHE
ncbi:MAG TPA: TIGR04255 family protein [Candidatus Baltobacteraceae bacterium]|nr:TIGR04255 family protein [Candidatus Baltobacteraceae bacterium]